ncbi:transmembrane protein, putative [Bodo saltans]|uniref:Transmembrane protein, putative n=1 Tax=Bodo saltans TaxID=75058 RepID=A0A0S4JCQ0_BODSA|nr:transmembrane protein, putative [Bodo saltans]|eukprot:CUG89325.1 transmembrane protein, putative [Bodo saltans]
MFHDYDRDDDITHPDDPIVNSPFALASTLFFFFFYAAKYRKSQKDRNMILFIGIAVFWLVSDVPLFAMDLAIMYYYEFQSVVQTATMILRSISFFVGATLSWLMYVHRLSKFLHSRYESAEEQEKVAKQQQEESMRAAKGLKSETKYLRHMVR